MATDAALRRELGAVLGPGLLSAPAACVAYECDALTAHPRCADAVGQLIAAGIVPAGLEMMDAPAIAAAEAFAGCGYPLDAQALLLCEVDGLPADVDADLGHAVPLTTAWTARFRVASTPCSAPETNGATTAHWRDLAGKATISHADRFSQFVRGHQCSPGAVRRRRRTRDAAARH